MRSIRDARKFLAGLVLLLAGTLVLAACGGDGVTSDELGSVVEQSVAAAVAAAVPAAVPAGPSAAEISAVVQQAVESAAPEGISAAEIGTLVEAAVAAASEPTVSAMEIESLVTQAVEQAAAGAATPLSASEIEAIVSAAIAAIPEPEPMVIAMPTAAPDAAMGVIVPAGTFRAVHVRAWAGAEVIDPAAPSVWNPLTYFLFDRPIGQDFDTFVTVPSLFDSWESNMDATQWTFNLRHGITYSDGKPLRAADVVYSAQRHIDPEIGSNYATQLSIVDPDGFGTPDDNTVVFDLLSANVDFPLVLTNSRFGIVPDGSGDGIRENPIGTGSFTVQSLDYDGVSVFNAREDYWNGSPLLGRITLVGIADADARVSAALAGQIDVAGFQNPITPQHASLFEGDPDFYIQESGRGLMETIPAIVNFAPFDDPRVFRALQLVIDPVEMVAVAAQGHGTPACNNPTWPIDQYYVAHDVAQDCPQDIEGAKALLAEAGFPDGLDLELETANFRPLWVPVATVYQQQAALAGINVELKVVPADGYWSTTWRVAPFSSSSWVHRELDVILSLNYRCGGTWAETFWCDPAMDALMDQARAELDFATRKDLYQQAAQIVADSGVIIPFHGTLIRAVNNRLQGLPENARDYQVPYHLLRIVEP